ncbi:S8 family serine peptidase [Streptomyces sp. XC 2026]|uniref:S8 family serine peptidase n=1 Tax=Streptomyces sp. XC 2026 TaxID=2782004 RepID=UPI001907CD0A|nr:S8 family serine peptidase [Streptomyces sp. XC 2026]QQN78142.1 S8 family serine peptidase [Streptomyces sp. XC 2026]
MAAGAAVPAVATPGGSQGGIDSITSDGSGPRVTLITGDQVVVGQDGQVRGLIRAEGRESIPVQHLTIAGDSYVIPQDARSLIRAGSLDQRLFNVSRLATERYQQAGGLPLIVTYGGQARTQDSAASLLAEAAPQGSEDSTVLESLNGEALVVTAEETADVWAALTRTTGGGEAFALTATPGITAIALDGVAHKTLAESVPQIGAPEAWEAGYDGEGVKVAVVDTGVSDAHPDLADGKVTAAENFSDSPDAVDRDGHGTHVASTVAGTGAHSGGTYTGVAPGAEIISAKVLDDNGGGWESDIIEGMEWAVDQGADIISMSLGGPAGFEIDPMEEAVNRLSAESDALFVIAAGNSGPFAGSIGSPGTADAALTIGAVDKSDQLADFSSVGPRTRDGALKPDVTAPGVDIAAAGAPDAAIWQYGDPVADGYVAISGTSMATPHASGAAALLKQQHPEWTGEQLKAVLTGSTIGGEGLSATQQGSGRIDVPSAMDATVIAETTSLSFGVVPFPHEEADPVTRELTYRNLGDTEVTLDLALETLDTEGGAAPEGFYTLSADQVTVPAGGTATVEVTARTALGDQYGIYSAYITATGDNGQSVRTAGAVEREAEKFDIALDVTGRDGDATEFYFGDLYNLDTDEWFDIYGTARVPEGEYAVTVSVLDVDDAQENVNGIDWLVVPGLTVTEDTTVSVDAREAEEVVYASPDDAATQTDLAAGFVLEGDDFFLNSGWSAGGLPEGFGTAQLGEPGEGNRISGYAGTSWERDDVQYQGAYLHDEGFFTGLQLRIKPEDLAEIVTRQGSPVEGDTGVLFTWADAVGSASGFERELPRTTRVFVETTHSGWGQELLTFGSDGYFVSPARAFEAGETVERTFNVGVFGPIVDGEYGGLVRDGDTLYGALVPFADGEGNFGYSSYDEDNARTVLYRDGAEFAVFDDMLDYSSFDLPAEEADYELVTTVGRDPALFPVTTEITASFTFTSAGGADDEVVTLPASGVRYSPALALDSTAPAGESGFAVPFTVQGSGAGDGSSVVISYSTDGGETWLDAAVADGAITVDNPAAGGSVSLRAEVTDADGNTSTQTIIDAYRTA